ncbi:preprotein translocase subunit SecE [Manganibacter manganicus]|uniref:Protein translocase subunit SecE n=1 Tax=Manganibacter manganicus TaxID=1873176 RepID=A0A1V8RMI2_9HYPH|nr:preprotein translocase subunit SecE [Pseudaminobacter manganicus]OQM74411.1 preprotein translocase subunit SecE [Pseudaminobacter manganicus]
MASKTLNPFVFLQQVRSETAKVTWPTRRETLISTVMVLIFAALTMLFFFGADLVLGFAVERILGLGQ